MSDHLSRAEEGVVFRSLAGKMRFFWEVDLLLLVKSGFNNISYGWDIGNSVLSSRLLFPFPIPNSHFRATKQWQILPKRLWLLLELPETKTLSLLTFDRKLDAFCIVYIAIADSIWFFSKTLCYCNARSTNGLHTPYTRFHSFSKHFFAFHTASEHPFLSRNPFLA